MKILTYNVSQALQTSIYKEIARELGDKIEIYRISETPIDNEGLANFHVIDIDSVKVNSSIASFQKKYDFSIQKALVTDREVMNYSTFNNFEKYTGFTDEFEEILLKYLIVLDEYIPKMDFLVLGLADNFKSSLAWNIAEYYNIKHYSSFPLYWWKSGLFITDTIYQTSSLIDKTYKKYYDDQSVELDEKKLLSRYDKKVISYQFKDNQKLPFLHRLQAIRNNQRAHNRLNVKHWILRRFFYFYTKILVKLFVKREENIVDNENFVLYPMHIIPEAATLGSNPEIADQFSLIKNISMNLPYGVKLYVKEHPGQVIGYGMHYDFYRKLLSVNNIKIVHKNVNTKELYQRENCLALAVINGTLGLEAALVKKPVFVFGEAIYGVAECFYKIKDFSDFFTALQNIIDMKFVFNKRALLSILQALEDSNFDFADLSEAKTYEEYARLGATEFVNKLIDYHQGNK